MFDSVDLALAQQLIAGMRERQMMVATAESCTGGLICALLTEIAGSSDVVECGFTTYSNQSKIEFLGVPESVIETYGAVSRRTAVAMADGARSRARTKLAVAVTGIAGPGGGSHDKPVGLVHLACAIQGAATLHREQRFGDIGRHEVRIATVRVALAMLAEGAGIKL